VHHDGDWWNKEERSSEEDLVELCQRGYEDYACVVSYFLHIIMPTPLG